MTKSKIEFATQLANLRKDGSDPAVLARDMTLRKLLYEIERLEQKAVVVTRPRPFWSWLTANSSDDE